MAASLENKKPIDEEEEEDFKASTSQSESKMVSTVSTETLKPTTSDNCKKTKKKDSNAENITNNNDKEPNDGNITIANSEISEKNIPRVKRNSSSSETESASSGDDTSTDTG